MASMDAKRSFVWAGKYFALTTVFALVGLGFVAGGVAVGFLNAETTTVFQVSVPVPTTASAPGFLLVLLGVLVWRFGKAWAFFKTVTEATEEEVGETFDTEHVKSDIVTVLDDRLTDMQHDIQSVNRELRDLKEEDRYDFTGEGEADATTEN